MYGGDETLADEDVLSVLRQQLPPELQKLNSVEELLDYTISRVKAARDAAIKEYLNVKELMTNIKILANLGEGDRAYINAGNNVFLPAKLKGNRLLVDIGYQFHVEMEVDEAEAFCKNKLELIQRNIDTLNRKVAEQRAQGFIIAETLCNMSPLMGP